MKRGQTRPECGSVFTLRKAVVKLKGNYGYSGALTALWQEEAGRADGVTRRDGTADISCHSIVKTADGGVLPSQRWRVITAIKINFCCSPC